MSSCDVFLFLKFNAGCKFWSQSVGLTFSKMRSPVSLSSALYAGDMQLLYHSLILFSCAVLLSVIPHVHTAVYSGADITLWIFIVDQDLSEAFQIRTFFFFKNISGRGSSVDCRLQVSPRKLAVAVETVSFVSFFDAYCHIETQEPWVETITSRKGRRPSLKSFNMKLRPGVLVSCCFTSLSFSIFYN